MTTYPSLGSELKRYNSARLAKAAPLIIFFGAACLLAWMFGHRLILGTCDEGIYLDAGERIVHGQKPYVDFFGYMTPGSFWMQALAFRLLGVTLAAGRAPVILYLALECALVYWLVERYASRATATVTTLLFLVFQTADPNMLTAQHRWDSSALALASIALCVAAQSESRRPWLAGAGILAAFAALATPSVALVALVTLAWLAWPTGQRSGAAWYSLGLSIAAMGTLFALWATGTLAALLEQLAWLSRNYSSVNVMHYGTVIGGYRELFADAHGWELPIRFGVVFWLALPAILPVLGLLGGVKVRVSPYLLLCVIALVVSTHPRSDVAHLAYVAALPYALAGIVVYRLIPARTRAWIAVVGVLWATVLVMQAQLPSRLVPLHTPVGDVRASPAEAPAVADLLSRVQPRQSLFVYPYKPLLYFLTQGENPTRYSYLQMGLMTKQDFRIALSELEARPPEWVLYLNLSQTEFDRVFPSAKGFNSHDPQLENWITANYRPSGAQALDGYVLLKRALPSQ